MNVVRTGSNFQAKIGKDVMGDVVEDTDVDLFQAEYWRVNAAVNDVFFDGRFQDRPVYLDPDGSLRAPLAQSLGVEEENIDECIGAAAAGTLSTGIKNIYAWHTANARSWDHEENLPPYTALLLSFSLAAKHMHEGNDISQNNYYGRLSEVFCDVVSREEASNARKASREFWISLNLWLQEADFIYGRPTAQQVTNWTYVSYALSQALVREADRDSFKKLFSRYGLSAEDGLGEAELEPYLADWMLGAGPSGFLKRIWSQDNLRDRVVAAALQELEVWDGLSTEQGHGVFVSHSRRLFWVLRVKKMPKKRVSMYLCAGNDSGDETGLTASSMMIGGKEFCVQEQKKAGSFAFVNLPGADACYLSPTESIDRGRAMIGEVTFVDSGGTQYFRASRPIVPMTRGTAGHFYREISQVVKHEKYVVLCHGNWKQRVEEYLDCYGRDGYEYLEGSKYGLPEGWGLFEKVELVTSPIVEIENDLQDLVPLERGATIYFSGGLALARDVWHASCPPNVFATESGEVLSLRLVEPGLTRDKTVLEEDDSVSNPDFIRSSGVRLQSRYYKLVAYVGRSKKSEKNISFRNADIPRQHVKGEERYLSYLLDGMSVFDSAVVTEEKSQSNPSISGMQWLSGEPDSLVQSAISLDDCKKLPFVMSDHIEYELIVVAGSYDDEGTESTADTCISRGCHAWSVPYGVSKKTKKAILTCGDCGASVVWKAKSASSNKQKSKFTPGTMKKVLVNFVDDTPTADEVYDALCYTGFGSWPTLQKLLGHLVDEPWKAYEKAKELSDLGFIDLELDSTTKRPRAWSIPPPTLVGTGDGRVYLSGFRCDDMLLELEVAFEMLEATPNFCEEKGVPKILSWDINGVDAALLGEVIESVKDSVGRKISVAVNPALKLVSKLPNLAGMLSQFGEATLPLHNISRFIPSGNTWQDARFDGKSGLYRYDGLPRKYFFVDSQGVTRNTTFELGKIAAAKTGLLRLHDYDPECQTFISVLGCEPPGLFRRALVACSGRLPVFGENNTLRYSNVSAELAKAILGKLYLEDK